MDTVVLHLTRRDLGNTKLPKEREKVNTEPDLMAFGPALAVLALRDDLILLKEALSDLCKGFLR